MEAAYFFAFFLLYPFTLVRYVVLCMQALLGDANMTSLLMDVLVTEENSITRRRRAYKRVAFC